MWAPSIWASQPPWLAGGSCCGQWLTLVLVCGYARARPAVAPPSPHNHKDQLSHAHTHTRTQNHKDQLLALFDWLVPVSLRFLRREITEASPTLDGNLVSTLMRNITSLTSHLAVSRGPQP